MSNYEVIDAGNGRIIKAWKRGVKFEDKALRQRRQRQKFKEIIGEKENYKT